MSLLKHKKLISREDHDAASIMAGLSLGLNKRSRDDLENAESSSSFIGGNSPTNAIAEDEPQAKKMAFSDCPTSLDARKKPNGENKTEEAEIGEWVLKPAPFFYYKDHSREVDEDPSVPVTAPGRVANFPAKMHEILNNPELTNIITWCPHGRAWRILKPRQFEIHVLPHYFQHQKLSSFVRQANGWGFRRLSQGHDRNSYYHEHFLRGLPHLVKKMKRPKVAEKKAVDPEYEPDFYAISRQFPVPYSDLVGRREEDEKEMRRIMGLGSADVEDVPQEKTTPLETLSSSVLTGVSSIDGLGIIPALHGQSIGLNMETFAKLPPGLLDMIKTNPHFAAGFLAASTVLGQQKK